MDFFWAVKENESQLWRRYEVEQINDLQMSINGLYTNEINKQTKTNN